MTISETAIPLAVTTSGKPDGALVERAQERAAAWGLPYLARPRGDQPLPSLLETVARALLVVEKRGVTLWDRAGRLAFHAGIAHLRILRIERGEEDTLVRVAGLQPGDHVLDCTLGLGQDALVMARAVGASGRVVGVERSVALYAVVSEGLRDLARAAAEKNSRACAVEPVLADARAYLRAQPDRSFDVVFFDPMFDRPGRAQPGFEVLRRHAEHAPLDRDTLDEARRVARRLVVIKAARYSRDLARLGLRPAPGSPYAKVVWATLPATS